MATLGNRMIVGLCRALMACVLSATYAHAHDAGLSVANLHLKNSALAVELQFASADIGGLVPLDKNHDGRISPEEFRSALPELQLLGDHSVEASCDGMRIVQPETEFRTGASGEVLFEMNFALPQCTQLSLESTILKRLPAGHRQYLSLRDQRGNVLAERILDRSGNSLEADLTESNTAAAAPRVVERFLILGIQHIFTGYDHLLFLIGLLVTGSGTRASAKVITSFTLAHSLTLALSATRSIQLSPRFVEPLIAVSIIYVGVENIMRREPRGRALLTFGFGLIHGLGFASALREAGVGSLTGGVALPLVSFNLGVEMGQISIAALALPLIWKLRQQPRFVTAYFPGCCTLIVLTGTWFVQRVWW